MSDQTRSGFNTVGALNPGEYISDVKCDVCGSPVRKMMTHKCASCPKIAAVNAKTDCDQNAKHRRLELEREMRAIERERNGFDLVEY